MNPASEFLFAVKTGDASTVASLLQDRPSLVRARCDWNRQPLHYAAKYGHMEVARLLVTHGADLAARDDLHGCTPLAWTCVLGSLHPEMAELLIAFGAPLDIFSAVALGKSNTVRAMVQASERRALRSGFLVGLGGESAITTMVRADPAVLNARLSRHADRRQPLHVAVMKDRAGMIELLLDAGADIHARTASGRTALCIAAEWQRDDLADLLLSRGAHLDLCSALAMQRLEDGEGLLRKHLYRAPGRTPSRRRELARLS